MLELSVGQLKRMANQSAHKRCGAVNRDLKRETGDQLYMVLCAIEAKTGRWYRPTPAVLDL